MQAENLKVEHIERIIELYNSCVGPANTDFFSAESVLEDIQNQRVYDGYRIGSRWTFHSKLTFRSEYPDKNIIPSFNPNFDPRDRDSDEHLQAEKAGQLFEKKSLEYLSSVE
jgi:hypothetical protein